MLTTYATQVVHATGCPYRTLYKHKHSAYVPAQALMFITYAPQAVHATDCPYRTLHKHEHSRTQRASLRLSMPNTVQLQAQCVRTSTSTHVHYVRRPGCSCYTLHMYTRSMHDQACGPTHNRRIAQAVHSEHRTRACTRCSLEHADFRTLDASLKLPMPNTVHVHAQGARHARALTSNRSTAELSYTNMYDVDTIGVRLR